MVKYDPVLFSRILTETTLAFHIIYATIGVGVPLMIAIAQWVGIKKQDDHYILLARRWTRGFVITVAVGVVTGTAIGLQLSLLWPNFMSLAGQVISLPLFMETFAFFFEAIFLGIYLYTWDRFSNPKKHLLLLIPVAIGSSASAVFITIVNAFMNTPQGFVLKDGLMTGIEPLTAMFNPAMPTKVAHVLSTAYMTCAFILASISAFHLMKGKRHVYHKKAFHITMRTALIFSIATIIIGDLSGKFLAAYQPEKLAAAEWHFNTESQAPLKIFGTLTEDQEVKGAVTIPWALSILAGDSPNTVVTGLNDIPEDLRPPLSIHYYFDLMVTIGVWLTVLAFVYWIAEWKKWRFIRKKWFYRLVVPSGLLAILAIEFGWFLAEVGRQPWILRGVMKTAEGATQSDHVDMMLILFCMLYLVLAFVSVSVLINMFRKNPPEKELYERNL
ncbi:MAG: cytochrome ubiquinol oxidase subunit I [Tuberibacillus sp.]